MDHIPANMRMAAEKLSNYSTNKFRLETVSGDTAKAGKTVSVVIPEGVIIDTKSLKMHFDATTNQVAYNGTPEYIFGRLPQDSSSLISRVEIYLNGAQVQQGCAGYGAMCRLLKLGRSNRSKDSTIDRALQHGAASMANSVERASMTISEWKGFFGETSCRFLDTGLLGSLTMRVTFAGNEVLIPRQAGKDFGESLDNAQAAVAGQISYSVSNIYFTIQTVQLDEGYSQMLRERLASEQTIPVHFKNYYTYELGNISGNSATTRFSLSSQCIDKLYGTFRDANFATVGVKSHALTAPFSDTGLANHFRFRAFDTNATKPGTMRTFWSVNNVRYPQYSADTRDALFDLCYVNDKVHESSSGNLIGSYADFHDGQFVCPLMLSHPGEPIAVLSGYDSRGVNTSMTWEVTGMSAPAANAGLATTLTRASFVVAETTATLHIGLGKSAAISF